MICTDAVIINKGRIIAQGRIESLVEQFFPTARVEADINGPPAEIAAALRLIPGVTSARQIAGTTHWIVESTRGRDVREDIFELSVSRGWKLYELRQVGTTLEEVFMNVIAGDEERPETPPEREIAL